MSPCSATPHFSPMQLIHMLLSLLWAFWLVCSVQYMKQWFKFIHVIEQDLNTKTKDVKCEKLSSSVIDSDQLLFSITGKLSGINIRNQNWQNDYSTSMVHHSFFLLFQSPNDRFRFRFVNPFVTYKSIFLLSFIWSITKCLNIKKQSNNDHNVDHLYHTQDIATWSVYLAAIARTRWNHFSQQIILH